MALVWRVLFTNWARLATNYYNVNGNFSLTNAISPALPRFFLVELP